MSQSVHPVTVDPLSRGIKKKKEKKRGVLHTRLAIALIVAGCPTVVKKDRDDLFLFPELLLQFSLLGVCQVLAGHNITVLIRQLSDPADLDGLEVIAQGLDPGVQGRVSSALI